MMPDLDSVAAEFRNVALVILDAAAAPEAVAALRVYGTPTLIAVRDGVEVARVTGRRTRAELREMFRQLSTGDDVVIPRVGRGNRVVWTVAGLALAGAGLLLGPAWPLVAAGAGLAGYANVPGRRPG